jgi:hypothetical protein
MMTSNTFYEQDSSLGLGDIPSRNGLSYTMQDRIFIIPARDASSIKALETFHETTTLFDKPLETKQMKHSQTIALLQTGYTTIKVAFIQADGAQKTRDYTYKCKQAVADTLIPGDSVVVLVREHYKVAEVQKVDPSPDIELHSGINYKWIVQKVDPTDMLELVKKEDEFIAVLEAAEKQRAIEAAKKDLLDAIPEGSVAVLTEAIKQLSA